VAVLRFALHAVDARQRVALLPGYSWMGYHHFDAVGVPRDVCQNLCLAFGQTARVHNASGQGGGLEFCYSVGFESGGLREVAGDSGSRCSQTRVGGELQAGAALWFSWHGYWLRKHRKLPGTPGNSINRRSKDARCAGLCRWCNTFRKRRLLRFCCTGRKQSVRA
jgi:hypothetical protein